MLKYVVAVIWFFAMVRVHNDPPIVKIVAPEPGSEYKWNDAIRYSIRVADKEDGDTKFDEIPASQVLLEVRIETQNKLSTRLNDKSALHAMMKSNCMNCHAFNSKLIGPSYFDIGRKYGNAGADQLVTRIREGSSGIWGNTVMPTHRELTIEETMKMVRWILDNGDTEDVKYYMGIEGAVRLTKPQVESKSITLVASYLDKDNSEGMDSVRVMIKDE